MLVNTLALLSLLVAVAAFAPSPANVPRQDADDLPPTPSLDDAAVKKRDIDPEDIATVSCLYVYYTDIPYQDIGVDVAIALGGDGLVTIDN
ncbi:hypothetical protein IAR50_007206 [Cryptococcus sp. DSM 104548]